MENLNRIKLQQPVEEIGHRVGDKIQKQVLAQENDC